MKSLGFLFIVAIVIAAVGYYRGWFSVSTVDAGGNPGVTIGVDKGKLGDDAKSWTTKAGSSTAKALEGVMEPGPGLGPDTSPFEATLVAVDASVRTLTVTRGSETITLGVSTAVSITSGGASISLDALQAPAKLRLSFKRDGQSRVLTGIEVLS